MSHSDQKNALIDDLNKETAGQTQTIAQLQSQIRELTNTAEEVETLRDELDVWKTKAMDSEKAKAEVARYREKLEDSQYLEKHVEVGVALSELLEPAHEILSRTKMPQPGIRGCLVSLSI